MEKLREAIFERGRVLRRVYWRPAARVALIAYVAVSLVSTLGGEFASGRVQKAIRLGNHIPRLSAWTWAVIGLALLLVLGVEGAVQEFRRLNATHEKALTALQEDHENALGKLRSDLTDVRTERDAAKDEIERRFSALRYALRRSSIDYNVALRPDGSRNVQVTLNLANDSDEHLRYEMEHIAVFIDGQSVENPEFYNRGTIIPPHGTDPFRYPFVCGVSADWQTGSVEFAVRYGHPSAPLRYRKSQALKLRTSRLVGPLPPHDLRIDADLVNESEVEDV